ncbi:MAG: TetR/AcrR family transcriptional regulator [Proteobacteria bacterium]|nr:TetR/AcrR family transcriptional regulator [Pseudomonadota bacterium]
MTETQKKIPKQARSKAVVESILNATTQLLLAEGMKSLTTNHIAKLANVNIASLYQYFPDKESIVAKLIQRHVDVEIKRISAVMTQITQKEGAKGGGLMREENIRLIIKEFVDIHLENLELTQLLHMQVSHVACRRVLLNATQFFTNLIQNMLDTEEHFKHKDNSIRAYIITHSIDSLIQNTLIEQPDLFVQPVFLDELVSLSMRYLHKPL